MEYNEKQLQIIQTAEKLFADKGFDGTSVRDIADEASVNVAMISYYFGSKEKLLEALFTHRAMDSAKKLEDILHNKELSTLEKVNVLIDYYINKFQNQQCFHKIMMSEQVTNKRGVTHELIHHFKKQNQQLVKQLIHEGQKTGEFAKNIDVPMLMAVLVGTVTHMIATQRFYREINNLQDMPDEQFQKLIKKKLSTQLKFIFKATLTHEA
ncbi:TetR family transcriptional regulator [Ferruginibacter lapsinanis]|uniref:TetR/AcrR family transcriptional regulator n=1 Tax=Ferruginibacter lapsinanis TaxID=563172 RepID=UPI001E300C44|nr:TetR family transcriptional regulator [Ferruginibacter lapsinanis]UEG50934.1 TetR family transcriptional regulator [Ferruginibacter lapsinanis]